MLRETTSFGAVGIELLRGHPVTGRSASANSRRSASHFGTGCACGDYTCIWRAADWPAWRYDLAALAGFEGKLTSSKWAAIAKCSPDTALRDVNALLARGALKKSGAGGRSTSYELNDFH